jgi:hypothetical protein
VGFGRWIVLDPGEQHQNAAIKNFCTVHRILNRANWSSREAADWLLLLFSQDVRPTRCSGGDRVPMTRSNSVGDEPPVECQKIAYRQAVARVGDIPVHRATSSESAVWKARDAVRPSHGRRPARVDAVGVFTMTAPHRVIELTPAPRRRLAMLCRAQASLTLALSSHRLSLVPKRYSPPEHALVYARAFIARLH